MVERESSERSTPVVDFMGKLVDGKFSELFVEEEFDAFKEFIHVSALQKGDFFIAFPTQDNVFALFHYKIDKTKTNTERLVLRGHADVYISANETLRPDGLEETPIWWITQEGESKSSPAPIQ